METAYLWRKHFLPLLHHETAEEKMKVKPTTGRRLQMLHDMSVASS